MIEPEIKYENCEEIYSTPSIGNGELRVSTAGANNGIVDNGISNGISQQQRLKRNYNENLESMLLAGGGGGGNGGTGSVIGQFGSNVNTYQLANAPVISDTYYSPEQQTGHGPIPIQQTPELFKIKRQRRAESNILFSHPFFNLQDDWENIRSGETITAKCLSCKVTLRGHKNVSSNFIKHMKRLHPELYKVYENYKLLKFKGFTQNVDPSNGGGFHAQEQAAFFDTSAFLEHMATNVGSEQHQQHSAVIEHSTTPTSSNNVSAVGSDTLEYSGDSNIDTPTTPTAVATHVTSGVRLVSQEKILDPRATPTTEVDLSAKTLEQMSRLLDQKLNGFVTKAELEVEKESTMQQIEKIVADTYITVAAERTTSQVKDTSQDNPDVSSNNKATDASMQVQINALKNECQQLREAVQRSQSSKRQLQKELQIMDRTMRQRKLIIRNVSLLSTDETPKQAAIRVLRDFLQLTDIPITNVLILRQQNNRNNKHNLLLEVQRATDARVIFSNCFKFKNTGMVLENELSPSGRKRKSKLLVLRKEILRRNAKLKVFVRNAQLIVSGKQFYWDEVEGLSVGNLLNLSVTADDDKQNEESAAEQLKEITGADMHEFLNVLKNYDVK